MFEEAKLRRPNLAFIFIDDGNNNITKMPVSTDFQGGIVTMDNLLSIKNKSNSYCIGLKFLEYVHYSTNTIITTMFQLYERDPNFVNAFVFFVVGNDIVDPLSVSDRTTVKMILKTTNLEIPMTIETFIAICPDSIYFLGYYIPQRSNDYIHIFKKGSDRYSKGVVDHKHFDFNARCDSIFRSESWNILINEIDNLTFEQTKQIEVTHFILYLLMGMFFN